MPKLTDAELHELIELLSHHKGGGNHGEMAQAIRFAEDHGFSFAKKPAAK